MSDSIDNTTELDSYGVWVKRPGDQSEATPTEKEVTEESFDIDSALELPDFPETDFVTDSEFSLDDNKTTSEETIDENPISSTEDEDTSIVFEDTEDTASDDNSDIPTELPEDFFNVSEKESDDLGDIGADFDFEIDKTQLTEDSSSSESSSEDDGLNGMDIDSFLSDKTEENESSPFITEDEVPETSETDEINFDDIKIDETADVSAFTDNEEDAFISDDITLGEDTPAESVENEQIEENITTDSFDISFDENTENNAEETESNATDEIPTEEIDLTESITESTEEVSFDSINNDSVEETTESEETTTELSLDDFMSDSPVEESSSSSSDTFVLPEEDGEIDLDAFMDGGFSDESVAAGNNGYEPGQEPSSHTDGEISLDDFMDGMDFGSEQKEEEIVDEKPLEMDITFDSTVDQIETEDNIQTDTPIYEDDFTPTESSIDISGTEDVSSEFGDFTSNSVPTGSTEEIDLSDFGIDANAEETPINQDVEAAKAKEDVVDFDLSVSDENVAAAPVVNEIVETPEQASEIEKAVEQSAPIVQQAAAPVQDSLTSDLLKQIVADLSGLKNEINALKSNLEEMKAKEALQAEKASETINDTEIEESFIPSSITETEDSISQETVEPVAEFYEAETGSSEPEVAEENSIEDQSEDIFTEANDDNTGFFGSDDGDDTIALSGNELDNIMNSVEISEESTPSDSEETQPDFTDEIIPETIDDSDNGFFGSDDGDDTIALSGNELDDIMNSVEISEEPSEISSEEEPIMEDDAVQVDSDSDSDSLVNDSIFGSVDESISFEADENTDFVEESTQPEEENLEEPSLDDIDLSAGFEAEEELPDEITIPREDDIMVGSSDDDFMSSVSTDEKIDDYDEFMKADPSITDSLTGDHIDYLSTDENQINDEDLLNIADNSCDSVNIDETIETTDDTDFVETTVDSIETSDADFEQPTDSEEPVVEEDSVVDTFDFSMASEENVEENTVPETDTIFETTDTLESEITTDEPIVEEEVTSTITDDIQVESETTPAEIFMEEAPFATVENCTEGLSEIETENASESENEIISENESVSEVKIETPSNSDVEVAAGIENEVSTDFDSIVSEETLEDNNITSEDTQVIENEFVNEETSVNVDTPLEEPVVQEAITEEKEVSTPSSDSSSMNSDLKKDIKSVLLYMDQLLENLPEDKIVEFAKSEEFETYKKLFSELGLA